MAAPSNTVWGNIITGSKSTRKGRIGMSTTVTTTATQLTVKIETWFWSMYSIEDTNNSYYYNAASSATSLVGSVNINHTVATGSGWSTSNQTKLGSSTYTYNRGTSAVTKYFAAKLTGIDNLGSGNVTSVSTSVTVPARASYAVKYNANGGSGAPSAQTKWYGTTLKLSTTKPTRTGYSFQGWSTANDSSVEYSAGANYTANAAVTLYAVWKANTYTVKFDANGGSGAPANQTKTYGVTLKLSSTKPTRTNYTFKGWSASKSATTATYSAGGSYTSNAAVTLYAVWELAYKPPKITNISVARCDSTGTASVDGTYALVKFSWSTFITATEYTILVDGVVTTVTLSGTSGEESVIVGNDALNPESSYVVVITVSDSSGSTKIQRTISSRIFPIDFLEGGRGVAFGMTAKTEDEVEFGWEALSHHDDTAFNHIHPNSGVRVGFGVGSGGVNRGIFDKGLGRWLMYGDGEDFYYGTKYGNKRPYYKAGDNLTVAIRTAGFCTSSGTQVQFIVPLAMPVLGNSVVTVSAANFTFRQGGKYTHGSSATATCTASSISASLATGITGDINRNAITIIATFEDTTNVVNNDSIGIYATLNIVLS